MSTVGFIGLGIMGSRMCANLLDADTDLVVFDLSESAVAALESRGARRAASPREVAEQSDFLLLSLPDSPQVEQVVHGEDGVLAGARAGLVVADLSSIAAAAAQKLARDVAPQGVEWLDTPVSGGPAGAEAGTLTIMVGGESAALEKIRPVLDIIGGNIQHMGPAGMGCTTKTVNQLAIGIQMIAMCEAFSVGAKAGSPAQRLWEVLVTSTSRCWVMEDLVKNVVLTNKFDEPRFAIKLIAKDMRIAAETAKTLKVPAAATGIAEQMFAIAEGNGWGDMDQMAVLKLYGNAVGIDQW